MTALPWEDKPLYVVGVERATEGADRSDVMGTGFQVEDGLVATAYHVLSSVQAETVGSQVTLVALWGEEHRQAEVVVVDPALDLALLRCKEPFSESAPGMGLDALRPSTALDVPGFFRLQGAQPQIRGGSSLALHHGLVQTEDGSTLVRIEGFAVEPGMSGAPVRRDPDGHVIGMLTRRYHSATAYAERTAFAVPAEEIVRLIGRVATLSPGLATALDEVQHAVASDVPDAAIGQPVSVPGSTFCPVPPKHPQVWLGAELVTNGEFLAFLQDAENSPWRPEAEYATKFADAGYLKHWSSGEPKDVDLMRPVVNVSTMAAQAFLRWDGERSGLRLRLPWSREWELAAAADQSLSEALAVAVEQGRVNYRQILNQLADVDHASEDGWGLRDLFGNAADLCLMVNRDAIALGGSWQSTMRQLESFTRLTARECRFDLGFRRATDVGPNHDS